VLDTGGLIPTFEVVDQRGATVTDADLRGRPAVVFFYPRADTPGCTKESCAFRDARPSFDALGVRVVGVSGDKVAAQAKFDQKYGLTLDLLADPEHRILEPWGVWAEKKLYGKVSMGIVRTTFLIDAAGVVRHVWRGVKVDGHVDQVLARATELFGA
jgi:peroxiredoxin Q/BCP